MTLKTIIFIAIGVLLLGGGVYAVKIRGEQQANRIESPSDNYGVQNVSLSDAIDPSSASLDTLQSLSINGQLRANNSLIIAPTDRPTQGVVGQVYYDNDDNMLAYYDGIKFVNLAGTDDVAELQAQLNALRGSIPEVPTIPSLPEGIATQSGDNTFTGSNVFAGGLSGTSLALSGAAALQSTLSVTGATSLGVVSATSLNVAGNTTLGPTTISNLVLSSPLSVSSGGTGSSSFTNNGILLGQGTSPVGTVSAAGAGLCLLSTAGAPAFQACPGGGGSVVDSLNGLSGPLTLANATGLGSTITINDASTVAKGIASFDASNFSVVAGVVNTIQSISVTSTPTFAGLTLSGNLAVGTNSIVTSGATISSVELDVLDGGILESEVTGVITDVTAGTGLTGGAGSGNATVNIASANGGILVGADDIALVLQPTGNALSATTSSGSGLEILSSGLTLLQGCSDGELLKWNETTDVWACGVDAGSGGLGDDISVNGANTTGANFIDTVASGTSAGVVWALNTTPSPDEISLTVSNASGTVAGVVTTGIQSFAGDKTFGNAVNVSGLFTANGGLTIETGDTLTFNGDALTDLSGDGLVVAGGILQASLGTAIDSSEITDLTITGADIANDTITDTQLAFNTGQNLTVSSTPSFAGIALTGSLNLGANSIVTSGATISSVELDVLDGGILESEVTGVITDVTAGTGLTGGAGSGNATLNISSANGGIAVNADDIALILQPTGDALSATTSSGSGLEILATGLSLLQGCSDNQILKWNEATDTWGCATDAGSGGLGDDISVNGAGATNANFIDTIASGTTAGVAWVLNTTPSPDDISLTITNASGTQAGVVTTGIQSFAGDKTFNNTATVAGLFSANGGITVEAGDTFTFNGDAFTDLSGTGLTVVGGILQASLGVAVDSSEITDLTITGDDIADDTIALGTKTTGNYVAGNTGGTGIVVSGSAGEGWSPTISLDYSNTLGSNSLSINQSSFAATGILFEGSTADSFETLFTLVDPTADNTITLPNQSGTICLSTGNCPTGGNVSTSGGTTNLLAKFTTGQNIENSTISDDGSNVTTSVNLIVQGGNVTAGTNAQLGSFILNDGNGQTTTLRAGDSAGNLTFILPTSAGSAYQCLKYNTGGQLVWDDCDGGGGGGSGVTMLNGLDGSLTIQGSTQIGVNPSSPNIELSINADSIGDGQLAFNTGQHLTTASAPSFAGLTLTGDLSVGSNNIVTGLTTISSAELDVLDGGIDEGEVTGVITDVTAGNGLTGGAGSGNATLNVASANGAIIVNADSIAFTLQPTGDALSGTTSSGSGLEILSTGLSLLQGCADSQILKWNETTDTWGCAADAGGSGLGDDVLVNGSNADGANFIDSAATGTSAGIVWSLNTTPSPDEITLTVSNASATVAGVVTTGVQSFAGDKTFNSAATITGLFTANGGVTIETGDTFTFNGEAFTDLTGTGLTISGGALQVANDAITDAQLAFDTGQHLTVSSAPTFAGLTLNGNIGLGTNSIVTSGATISSVELDILDAGIDESEVTGVITDVTAGNGLAGGSASGSATLNVASANGGIAINADNIALTLQPTGDALSGTTSAGSGLEILAGGLTLLQGCSDGQILKWDEAADTWSCSADAGGSGVGDDLSVNGSNADGGNFINTVVSGSTAGVTWNLNTTPSPDEISVTISNASATEAGVVTTGVQSFAGDKTYNNAMNVSGLFTANGGITVEAGDTFTFNGDAFTDLTGTGLIAAGGVLQASLGTAIDSSEITDLTITGADIANDTITDTQLAFDTGQHLTVSSTPSFAGITLTGNLSIGANSIVTSGATISSVELNVLDGGISEGEVTGVITDVTAGNGLSGGAAAGNATLDIGSANGGIVVNADNIALTLQPSGNGLSANVSSGSGLEILTGGLTLLQGCGDTQILKWNETSDVWACANDAGGSGLGDDVLVNGTNTDGANFINTLATGTSTGTAWNLNAASAPDDITLVISNASATVAGAVTTGIQAFAGVKTFNAQVVAAGGINLGTQTLQGTTAAIDFTNFDVLSNGDTTVGGTLTVTGVTTLNDNVTVAAGKSLTLTGGNTGSRPATPTNGMLYYDTTTSQLLVYNGTHPTGKWQADRSTATKIIAPSNASDAVKASADYVATGSDDGATVNTALAALPAGGGTVYLMQGTFTLGATSINMPNNTTLAGTGAATILTYPNAMANATYKAITNTDITTGTHVNVRDIMIDGNRDNQSTGNFYGIYFDNMGTGSGISAVDGGKINDVVVKNMYGWGIYLTASSNNTITGNTAARSNLYGISLNASSNSNTITGNMLQYHNNAGIHVSASSNNTITGNTAQGNNYGIFLQTATSNTITGNTTQGSTNYGMRLDTSSNNTITGNTVRDNGTRGIMLITSSNNNTITGNNISDNGGSGNNGIYLDASDSNTITSNNISDTSCGTGTTTCYGINIFASTSDNNYLADNVITDTDVDATTTINDAGTGTVFGGQVKDSSNGNFYIQPAGTVELMKNTNVTGTLNVTSNVDTNGSLTVGTADQFNVSNLGVVTAGTWQGGTIGLGYGGTNNTSYTTNGIVYSNGSALVSSAAGVNGQCLLATTGSAPTWGTCTATNLQGTYDASASSTINLTDNRDFTINAADTGTDSSIVFNLQCVTSCGASGGRFAIQDAGVDIFRINPNGDIIIGTAANNVTLVAANGYKSTASGTARNSKSIRLTAEYPGAVLDTGATGNNLGTMTSGYDQTNRMNYYNWTTTQVAAQSYDVVVQVPLPKDFAAWDGNTPVTVGVWSTTTAANTIRLQLRDSSNNVPTGYDFVDVTPGATSTWGTNTPATTITGTYTDGDYITLRLRLQAPTNGNVRVSNITLNYLSKF